MILPEKSPNCLRALNYVIVVARKMSYELKSQQSLTEVLDIAEYLPRLMADSEDRTATFRDCLVDLATRWPDFGPAVAYFDDPNLRWPW